MHKSGALSGISVIELASYVSGPYAGMMLADFGADVVKIEPPENGDPFRGWGSATYSPTFGSVNRNKKSVALDLKTAEGLRAAKSLIADADVVIENYRSGVLDRLGLGYEDIRKLNKRLIYCSITGFGGEGPYAARPGYDTVGQAMGGLLGLLTDLENPQPMGISLSDHLAGLMACNGILAALHARTLTGEGQRVETSLLESTVSFLAENAARFFETGHVPNRAARTHLAQVFAFVARDGRPFVVHLSSPTKFWEGLLRAIDRPEWKDDPRFSDRNLRIKNYEKLHAALTDIFRTEDRAHWLARLEGEDVPSGPLYDMKELFEDPQVEALELRVRVPHGALGHVDLIRSGVRLSATPLQIHSVAPELGEHTQALVGELLETQPLITGVVR
jgi:formyl-CoA transferase